MRLFEILLIQVNLALLLGEWLPIFRKPGQRKMAARLGGLLLFPHLLLEGYRWQMLPIYAVTGAIAFPLILHRATRAAPLTPRWLVPVALAMLLIGGLLGWALPVPRFPESAGPYKIGTMSYHWVDASRPEIYGVTPSGHRELLVQVWYPASHSQGIPPAPWLSGGRIVSRAIAAWRNLPGFLLDHVTLARTHTYVNAPLAAAEAPYPVVLYIHGWGGFRNINQDQIEALASHGYMVVAADHAYGALVSLYPDGRIAWNNPAALNGAGGDAEFARASNTLVKVYAADGRFILEQLSALNAAGPLAGGFNLDRVGYFGHSTGGGAVVTVCALDARCKAVLGMDTWVEPVEDALIEAGLIQPALFMNSESWRNGSNSVRLRQLYTHTDGPVYWLDIDGTAHYDFTATATLSPVMHWLGFKGPISTARAMAINNAYLTAFFDYYLKGQTAPLLDGNTSEFPEAHLEQKP